MGNALMAPRAHCADLDWRRAGTRAAPKHDPPIRSLQPVDSADPDRGEVSPPESSGLRNIVRCNPTMWTQLETHLRRSHVEEAAVMYAAVERRGDGITFSAIELEAFQPTDFAYQSDLHIELREAAQQRVIKRAWSLGCALIEVHSHVNGRHVAEFSGSDLAGFEEFVPHVWWRLRGQPYVAIVMAPSGIDAMVWRESPHIAESLQHVELDAATAPASSPPTVIAPTNATLTRRRSSRFDVASSVQIAPVDHARHAVRGGAS